LQGFAFDPLFFRYFFDLPLLSVANAWRAANAGVWILRRRPYSHCLREFGVAKCIDPRARNSSRAALPRQESYPALMRRQLDAVRKHQLRRKGVGIVESLIR